MTGKIPKAIGAIFVATAALALAAGTASAGTVYNNIPKPIPGNVASLGFEATQTSEFGGQVQFAGDAPQQSRGNGSDEHLGLPGR